MIVFGAIGFTAMLVGLLVPRLTREPEPLGFSCITPAQPVVEEVLGVEVDGSQGVGGTGSREATGTWTSSGTPIVHVTCRSLLPGDVNSARPSPDEAGYVEADPPFVLAHSAADAQDFDAEVRFVHASAEIRMELAATVEVAQARLLVESWLEQVRTFGGP